MGKHGLVTWADDSHTCYENSIRLIQEAEDYIRDQKKGKAVFGAVKVPAMPDAERHELAAKVLPIVRGLVSTERSAILAYDDSPAVLEYVGYERTGAVSQQGAACPDHLVHVKRQPLFVNWSPVDGLDALKVMLKTSIDDYKKRYVEYFERNSTKGDELRDASPRDPRDPQVRPPITPNVQG